MTAPAQRVANQLDVPLYATLSSDPIDFNLTGDNEAVAGIGGQTIRIMRLFLIVSADTNIIFKDGSTNLTGLITMYAGGSFVLDASNEPWFQTSVANHFNINQSGTAQISGRIYYQQSP